VSVNAQKGIWHYMAKIVKIQRVTRSMRLSAIPYASLFSLAQGRPECLR
jgi:hypothetical protein